MITVGHSPATIPTAGLERSLAYVVTALGWGGAETQVIDLATAFRKRGWKVIVISLVGKVERQDSLELRGITVLNLGMTPGIPDPRALLRLARILRTFQPTVVHAHMVHANLLVRMTRLLVSIPVLISTAHNSYEGPPWRTIAYRLTDRLTDLTTNVSLAAVGDSVRRGAVPRDRIQFVPNGVDFTVYRRDESLRSRKREELRLGDRFTWLAVGRMEKQKDYDNLLTALSHLPRHHSSFKLLIVGEGTLRKKLERRAQRLRLLDNVVFLGLRRDTSELMTAADAFVLSSAWEGLPMVLLEAAACKLPMVATDVGGCSEVVLQGKTGALVRPKDSRALADAMDSIMQLGAEQRSAMGALAAEHVSSQFGMEHIVDRWEGIYGALARRHERTPDGR